MYINKRTNFVFFNYNLKIILNIFVELLITKVGILKHLKLHKYAL
jgi:hypothetical protein